MTPEIAVLLLQYAIKYGPDAAIAIAGLFKKDTTIDQAIAALELAKTKTAEQYLEEAKAVKISAGSIPAPGSFAPLP